MIDIDALRAKQYSDDDIVGVLRSEYDNKFDFNGARKAGISNSDIIEAFKAKYPKTNEEISDQPTQSAKQQIVTPTPPEIQKQSEADKEDTANLDTTSIAQSTQGYNVPVEIQNIDSEQNQQRDPQGDFLENQREGAAGGVSKQSEQTNPVKADYNKQADELINELGGGKAEISKQSETIPQEASQKLTSENASDDGVLAHSDEKYYPSLDAQAEDEIWSDYKGKSLSEFQKEQEKLVEQAKTAKAKFENISQSYRELFGQLKDMAFGDEEAARKWSEKKEKLDNEFYGILKRELKLDDLQIDVDGNLFAIKDGKEYDLGDDEALDSFVKNVGAGALEIGGGVMGGIGGMKTGASLTSAAPNPFVKAAGVIGGGIIGAALGSAGGRALDVLRNARDIKKDIDALTVAKAAGDAAFGSVVFDTALLGTGKALKTAAKPAAWVAGKSYKYIRHENIGEVNKFLKNNGYDEARIKQINEDMAKYQDTSSDSFSDWILSGPNGEKPQQGSIKDKINTGLNYALHSKDKKDIQDSAFNVFLQDRQLSDYISSAAKDNPTLARMVLKTINDRALQASKLNSDLTKQDVVAAFKQIEEQTQTKYGDAIKLLDEALPETRFDFLDEITPKIAELENKVGDTNIKSEINGLINRLSAHNEPLSASEMIEVRKDINEILRKGKVKKYDDRGLLFDINSKIDSMLYDALEKRANQVGDNDILKIMDNFREANEEYKTLAKFKGSKIGKYLLDEEKTSEQGFSKKLQEISKEDKAYHKFIKFFDSRMSDRLQEKIVSDMVNDAIVKVSKDKGDVGSYVKWDELSKALDGISDRINNQGLKEYVSTLQDMARLFHQDEILSKELLGIKGKETGSTIATSVKGRTQQRFVNNIFGIIAKYFPSFGRTSHNDTAIIHHVRRAIKHSRSVKELSYQLISDPQMPNDTRKELFELVEKYKDAPDLAFKSYMKQKEELENVLNGDGFTMRDGGAAKTDYEIKTSVDDWVKELSEINNNELSANLFTLHAKHPEFFEKPSDVFRLLVEIKNDPTHFFKNNRPDMALITKILKDGSIGKLGIVKDSGHVGHATKSTHKNEIDRLERMNKEELGVGTPHPTLQHTDDSRVGLTAGAKAHSPAHELEVETPPALHSNPSENARLDRAGADARFPALDDDIIPNLENNSKTDIIKPSKSKELSDDRKGTRGVDKNEDSGVSQGQQGRGKDTTDDAEVSEGVHRVLREQRTSGSSKSAQRGTDLGGDNEEYNIYSLRSSQNSSGDAGSGLQRDGLGNQGGDERYNGGRPDLIKPDFYESWLLKPYEEKTNRQILSADGKKVSQQSFFYEDGSKLSIEKNSDDKITKATLTTAEGNEITTVKNYGKDITTVYTNKDENIKRTIFQDKEGNVISDLNDELVPTQTLTTKFDDKLSQVKFKDDFVDSVKISDEYGSKEIKYNADGSIKQEIDDGVDISAQVKPNIKGESQIKSKSNPAGIKTPKENASIENYHTDTPREYGSEAVRYKENIEAIKTLKELERSGAAPTAEQKENLARYNGWGGLSNAFNHTNEKWKSRFEEVKSLLSADEWAQARNSTLDSFYTPAGIVKNIWDVVAARGFKGGEILEPSMGVGNFFALMPKAIDEASSLQGVELDNITARIAKKLYPKANILNDSFVKFNSKKEFDLVVANPPFGDIKMFDKTDKELNGLNIHSYFVLKSLKMTKDNGLNVFVITSRLMDAKDGKVKDLINKYAELIGAVRLPDNAFRDTQVTTDILFLRKRAVGEAASENSAINSPLALIKGTDGSELEINAYFADNPDNILGDIGKFSGMYGGDNMGVKLKDISSLPELLKSATENFDFSGVNFKKGLVQKEVAQAQQEIFSKYAMNGSIVEKEGKFYRKINDKFEEIKGYEIAGIELTQDISKYSKAVQTKYNNILAKAKETIKGYDKLREAFFRLRDAQLDPNVTDGELARLRANLNKSYDAFKNEFGYVSNTNVAKIYDGDPTYAYLSALEKDYKRYRQNGEWKESAQKAEIFTKRTQHPYIAPTSADSLEDAINISLDRYARLDFNEMSKLLDIDEDEMTKDMLRRGIAYDNGQGGLISAGEFLSGNVKEKLERLKNIPNPSSDIKNSIKALENVIPADIDATQIGINAGANWIPMDIYKAFAKEFLGGDDIFYHPSIGWRVNFKSWGAAETNYAVKGQYKSASAAQIFEAALNNQTINMNKAVKDGAPLVDNEANFAVKAAIKNIKRDFEDFIYNDPARANEVAKVYNELFNTDVLRKYDGSALKFRDKNELIELRKHQKDAVFRIITNKNTLLDHTVGTGKTYTMIAAAMELRRLNLAKKPLIVVPKAVLGQWGKEFANLYPNAKIMVTDKFDAKSRQKTLASMATGDWDAVVISQENFKGLRLKPATEQRYMSEELVELETAIENMKLSKGDPINVKQLQATLKRRRTALEKINEQTKKDEIYFEDLGVDALFVDEAHGYKNLGFYTKMYNVRGLGDKKGSQVANDMFYKTRWLNENDKKIVFATGTPVVNSIAELYTMQRYLGLDALKAKGITTFDEWANLYGKVESNFEINAAGKYVQKERFAKFENLPELMREYGKFADIITNDDVKADLAAKGVNNFVPPIEKIKVIAQISPEQESYTKELLDRYEVLDKKLPGFESDNYLNITNDAKKASLDMRTINPNLPDFEGSKVNLAVKNVIDEYHRYDDTKGTQIICCDLSTPKLKQKQRAQLEELKQRALRGDEEAEAKLEAKAAEGLRLDDKFSVYEDMKEKLIKQGIPENEIAFIHDYDTADAKSELFAKVNSGEVRIVFGSTQKIGTGVNIQERVSALHNIDVPWTPAALEQRQGRVERQGNKLLDEKQNFKVKVYDYATKKMLDAMNWEKIEQKRTFIAQIRKGDIAQRSAEDISDDVVDAATMKALASGNPDILKEIELAGKIKELDAEKRRFMQANINAAYKMKNLQSNIDYYPKALEETRADIKAIEPRSEKENFVKIADKQYSFKDRGQAIAQILKSLPYYDGKEVRLGSYRGFEIVAQRRGGVYAFALENERSYPLASIKLGEITEGLFTRFDNMLKNIPSEISRIEKRAIEDKKELVSLKKNENKGFSKEAELREAIKEHDEIIAKLKQSDANNEVILNANIAPFAALLGFKKDEDSEDGYSFDGTKAVIATLLGLGALKMAKMKFSGDDIKRLALNANNGLKNSLARVLNITKLDKEKRGIYNVTFNEKKSTPIYKDLELIDEAIKYEKGFENSKANKGYGALHIQKHFEPSKDGYVTKQELLNMGDMIRSVEPDIKDGKHVYEYYDKDGIRFRVVIGIKKNGKERVISFYSNRKRRKLGEL
ncbi:N-6 DNA methylase [Campylobacter curvus]|uniref:N-6 DNA methylase n=1 Tax=Campylobacter curvus TaxID=200 RepID=UPI0014701C7B|nr:N-6 DNA methylase [Campylobacter curvus]